MSTPHTEPEPEPRSFWWECDLPIITGYVRAADEEGAKLAAFDEAESLARGAVANGEWTIREVGSE